MTLYPHISPRRQSPRGASAPAAGKVLFSLFLLGVVLVAMTPQPAYAGTPMSDVLCFILFDILLGSAGKGFATIGVCAIGLAAVMGKASWGLTITVGIGIAVLFGCVSVVESLGLGTAAC
ncbi:MAG: hypothetical protein EBV03_02175 [Proteobacteria bacterium]|nr:hypothetical protein [Pseudomonadota bacterium]